MRIVRIIVLCIFLLLGIQVSYSVQSQHSALSGLYAIWYIPHPEVLTLPYIRGGQVIQHWGAIEKNGVYNWQAIDSTFASLQGMPATLQVNGTKKPDYLFNHVPSVANWEEVYVKDPQDILMYWHPYYMQAYANFLRAYAAHVQTAFFAPSLLGIRLNFNAIGTEQLSVPLAYRKATAWNTPPDAVPGTDWSQTIVTEYQKMVLDAHINNFIYTTRPPIRVFVRNNLKDELRSMQAPVMPSGYTYKDYFYEGKLSWFHTSSEVEPRTVGVSRQYKTFLEYCRPGYTVGYAESWADAWGYHGGLKDYHWCTPPQWNYWRLLSDLHVGVSFIAIYGNDLTVAQNGTHNGIQVGNNYQQEFNAAFMFAAKYAGYHVDPDGAPGAWIAFRQSKNPIISEYNSIVTDYTMHMTLLNPQDTIGLDARYDGNAVPHILNCTEEGQKSIGQFNARFGAWARQIPQNKSALLHIDSRLVEHINAHVNTTACIYITYLDDRIGSFAVYYGTQRILVTLSNTGTWKTCHIPLTSRLIQYTSGAHIKIESTHADIIFHMVEVLK